MKRDIHHLSIISIAISWYLNVHGRGIEVKIVVKDELEWKMSDSHKAKPNAVRLV
jgi:hypothetical protein